MINIKRVISSRIYAIGETYFTLSDVGENRWEEVQLKMQGKISSLGRHVRVRTPRKLGALEEKRKKGEG